MTASPNYSVVILTLNEAKNLQACLDSLRDSDDIVVLDSGSTDGTPEIARDGGARVFHFPFVSFAQQRNYAQQLPFRHEWVFHLDADERFTPELAAECRAMAATTSDTDGYYVAPRMVFQGRWIRHCTDFPAWQARFVRARRFRFIDVGHGQREDPAMRMGHIRANYIHDLSTESQEQWIAKHRRYAKAEAAAAVTDASSARFSHLFAQNPLVRRRALKLLAARLPARGVLRFLYQYVLRRGFLDGAPGLHYCLLLSQYETFIAKEIRAIDRRRSCR